MTNESKSKFAKWLDRIRRPQESERAFADRLNISARTLRRIYDGEQVNPTTLNAIAHSHAHNLTAEEVFRLAGVLNPVIRFDLTDKEIKSLIDDLESLKGTPLFEPTLRAIQLMVDVAKFNLDAPE